MLRRLLLALGLALGASIAQAQIRLDIDGAPNDVAENVRNHIGAIADSEVKHPRRLRRRLRQTIPLATEALGYYRTRFTLKIDGKRVRLSLQLDEPVLWAPAVVRIEGDAGKIKAIQNRAASPPMVAGQRIDQGTYDNFKRDLLEACLEYGFLDAGYRT